VDRLWVVVWEECLGWACKSTTALTRNLISKLRGETLSVLTEEAQRFTDAYHIVREKDLVIV